MKEKWLIKINSDINKDSKWTIALVRVHEGYKFLYIFWGGLKYLKKAFVAPTLNE